MKLNLRYAIGGILLGFLSASVLWHLFFGENQRYPFFIREVTTVDEIVPFVCAGDETLVVFDVDNTLLWPEIPEARYEWFEAQRRVYKQLGLAEDAAKKRFMQQHLRALEETPVHLVDTKMRMFFDFLKENGVRLMAITARSFELFDLTVRQLQNVELDLSQKDPVWQQWHQLMGDGTVGYRNGIIFTDGKEKGQVLEAFLQKLCYKPETCIFVDDIKENIESVGLMARRMKISHFYGFQFVKIERCGVATTFGQKILNGDGRRTLRTAQAL